MASMRDIQRRKLSVQSTGQITKAMKLVSTVKLQKSRNRAESTKPYFNNMYETVTSVLARSAGIKHRFLQQMEGRKKAVIVITSNRGLAGGYNSNIFKLAESLNADDIIPIGKRACDKYGKAQLKVETYSYEDAILLANRLCEEFKGGKYEKIGIVSTKYVSMMLKNPEVEWVLPIAKAEKKAKADIIYEPDERTVLEAVIGEYIAGKIVAAAREGFACEVVARRFAMDNAGKNAGEMIDSLKLEYNRARQGAITQEITEIVAGSGM